MFGFGKKKPETGFKDLPEVRDLLKELVGEAMHVYTGTVVGYLMNLGKTVDDVKRTKEELLSHLQRYVQAEILLYNQKRGHEPDLAELAGLRLK